MVCTARALSEPTSPWISPMMRPCTASAPNTKPAMAMVMTRSGGEGENRVIREGRAHARHFVFGIFGISGFEQLEKRLGPPGEALARRIVRRNLAIGFAQIGRAHV